MANVLRHWDPRGALAVYDEALRWLAEIRNNPKARRDEIHVLVGSTYPLRSLGRFAEGRERLDAAFSRLRDLKIYPVREIEPGSEAMDALGALAEFEAGTGKFERAIGVYQELLDKMLASQPSTETDL